VNTATQGIEPASQPALRGDGRNPRAATLLRSPGPTIVPEEAATPPVSTAATDSPRTLAEAIPVFLRHASPRLLLAIVAVLVPARLWLGAWSAWDVAPVAALLALWPIQEWLIHVYILHFKPVTIRGWSLDFRVPQKHRAHHRDPWNYEILFIPFHSFAYSIPLTVLLWWAVTPTPALALTGLTAHFVLALHYEWIHFLIHTRVMPRSRFYQQLWRTHRLHHFKNEHYWYGVTRREGDWLLGTAPAPAAVPLSPTARTLLEH
jgi:hypothetical protein